MSMKTLLMFAFSLSLFACSDVLDEKHYYVTPELKVFVDRFYKEAEARGITLQKDRVSVTIKKLDYHAGAGEEGLTDHKSFTVFLDSDFVKYNLIYKDHLDSMAVEYVVFHELGHLLLFREHLDYSHYTIMTKDGFYKSDFQSDPDKRKKLITELLKN